MSPKALPPRAQGAPNALTLLDTLLSDTERRRVSKDQVMLILDALASATDSALVERFPAVLAICARSGIALDAQALFSRYWESSPKRQNLEQLLLISAELLKRQKMAAPGNLNRIAAALRHKYPQVAASGMLRLSSGVAVTIEGLRQTLDGLGLLTLPPRYPAEFRSPEITSEISLLLSRLFSPKQKELVLKKLNNHPMTKTEREYYSRSAKKKLEAIMNETVQHIAVRLVGLSDRKR